MRKTHLNFLRRAVSIAAAWKESESLPILIDELKHSKAPIYGLMKVMVCDPRFHTVIEDNRTWREFAVASLSIFFDAIEDEEWKDIKTLNDKVETFLNRWFAAYILPVSEIEMQFQLKRLNPSKEQDGQTSGDSVKWEVDGEDGAGEDFWDYMVTDCTSDGLGEEQSQESSRGKSAGGGAGEGHDTRPQPLACFDSNLHRLAYMIGRRSSDNAEKPGKFLRASKSDIEGVTTGNDIAASLPSELAMLATRETEDIFYDKFTRNRLQVFASASMVRGEKKEMEGPVFVCVDTSGSMTGDPERMAKSLTLAIAEIAQRRKRPVCLINYSHTLSFFVLTDITSQRRQLMKFLSQSYGGGNDENLLFNFIFNRLPKAPDYRRFAKVFKGADLLIVSDFFWGGLDQKVQMNIERARKQGMRFFALGIGNKSMFEGTGGNEDEDDREYRMVDGFDFYKKCDFKFVYDDGACSQVSPSFKRRKCERITTKH